MLLLPTHDVYVLHYVDCRPFDFYGNHAHPYVGTVLGLLMYNRTSSSYACEMVLKKCSKGLRNSYFVLQHALQAQY